MPCKLILLSARASTCKLMDSFFLSLRGIQLFCIFMIDICLKGEEEDRKERDRAKTPLIWSISDSHWNAHENFRMFSLCYSYPIEICKAPWEIKARERERKSAQQTLWWPKINYIRIVIQIVRRKSGIKRCACASGPVNKFQKWVLVLF